MFVIEPTKYKTTEELHAIVSPYIISTKSIWLPDYTLTVSKGYPGLIYNPNATSLIQVELFEVIDTEIENYKACISNRHITWETINKEVYDTQGNEIKRDILIPVLKPLTSILSISPIYHPAPSLTNWTLRDNKYLLEQKELASRKLETNDNYYPTAMEL
jgi:hypothetical protein